MPEPEQEVQTQEEPLTELKVGHFTLTLDQSDGWLEVLHENGNYVAGGYTRDELLEEFTKPLASSQMTTEERAQLVEAVGRFKGFESEVEE